MNIAPNTEILLEGTYIYFNKEVNYSQENFKLVHLPGTQVFHLYAEILSRVETGEFFKILVHYEMNNFYIPYFVSIEKSMGARYALETYNLNLTDYELSYSFRGPQNVHEFTKKITPKNFLSSPALSTAAIFTLSRKFDPTERTSVHLLNSDNEWTYQAPPNEKTIYAEFKSRDIHDFQLNGNTLSASLLHLYSSHSSGFSSEPPVELYLSKHYNIPYQLTHGDQRIVIKTLKKMSI
jgi:hypothetical protein